MKLQRIFGSIIVMVAVLINMCHIEAMKQSSAELVAHWDMNGYVFENNNYYFDDLSGNNIKLSLGYDQYNLLKNEYVAKNSDQRSLYRDYVYIRVSTEEDGNMVDGSEKIAEAMDGSFTFETWLNVSSQNNGVIGAVYMVTDGGTNFINELQIVRSGNEYGLTVRRIYESGATYYILSEMFELDKWYHFAITLDSDAGEIKPKAYVNGKSCSVSDAYGETASGSQKLHTPGQSYFILGETYEGGNSSLLSHASYGETKIYDGCLTAEEILEEYDLSKEKYENGYIIKIENNHEAFDDAVNLKEGRISFNVDLTDIQKESITDGMIRVVDAQGNDAGFLCNIQDGLCTVSKEFVFAGEYILIIDKSISDIYGNPYRNFDYELKFTVGENTELRNQILEQINALMMTETMQNSELMVKLLEYNYIIGMDVSEDSSYSKIINKENIFGLLRNKEYISIEELKNAFDEAVEQQALNDSLEAVEEVLEVTERADENMVTDLKELLFTKYQTVFKIDTTEYEKLIEPDKAIEYMKELSASTVDGIIAFFDKCVKRQYIQERTFEMLEKLEDCNNEEAIAILAEYNDLLEFNLENKDFIEYQNAIISDLINSKPENLEDINKILNESLLLNAINGVAVGDREKIISLLDEYEEYWEMPDSYKSMSHEEKMKVAKKLNGKTFNDLQALAKEVKNIIDDMNEDDSGSGTGSGSGSGSSSGWGSGNGSFKTEGSNYFVDMQVTAEPVPPSEIVNELPFDDIQNVMWAYDGIKYLYDNQILSGKEEGKFYPDDNITREEFAKIAAMAFGYESENSEQIFDDVNSSDWSFEYINALCEANIIKGKEENIFDKKGILKRCDLAVIMDRIMTSKNIVIQKNDQTEPFADFDKVAEYAKEAVLKMQKTGIMNGVGDNYFAPEDNVTRAAAVKVIYALISVEEGEKTDE